MQYPDLDWQTVAARRAGHWLGDALIYRHTVDSTNTLAASLIPTNAPSGTVVIAEFQSAGRGRLHRPWVALPGSALTFTVVLGPLEPSWLAPMAAGLAVAEALGELGLDATLKWPNDVLLAGRKCAGILIETRRVAGTYWLLAGIGLNVRSVDPALETATYLDAHTATPVLREDLLVVLLAHFERHLLAGRADANTLRNSWRSRLETLDRPVTVHTPRGSLDGHAIGIDVRGALLIRLHDGSVRTVDAGDVTLASVPPR